MTDIDPYITDEAVQAALAAIDLVADDETLPEQREALRAALPGILSRHRADVLREASLNLGAATGTYPGLTPTERRGFAAAVRYSRRMVTEAERAEIR